MVRKHWLIEQRIEHRLHTKYKNAKSFDDLE